jgi:hypothetical protein
MSGGNSESVANVSGCMSMTAVNYNRDATTDNKSCYGCNTASVNNGSCPFLYYGCMNDKAANYRPQAIEHGTCTFEDVSNRPYRSLRSDTQNPVWVNGVAAVSSVLFLAGTLTLGKVVFDNLSTTNTNKVTKRKRKSMDAGNIETSKGRSIEAASNKMAAG